MDKTYERITIKDIAERCGVTANTVSRALRNDTKLSEATLKKVQQTAQEMGYIRLLPISYTCLFAFNNQIAYHAVNALRAYGYRVPKDISIIGFDHPFGTDEYIRLCKKIGCEPYICTNTGTGTAEEMSDWVEYCNPESEGRYAKRPGILQPGERNLPVGRQGTKLIQ